MRTHIYLSLGAGLQSSLLAIMIANKHPDLKEYWGAKAIFSDTGGEIRETYKWLDTILQPYLEERGMDVIRVSMADYQDGIDGGSLLTTFMLKQQVMMGWANPLCSSSSKRDVIRKYYRQMHGVEDKNGRKYLHQKHVRIVELIGITTDEILRAKDSDVGWLDRRYPLVDMNLSRQDLYAIYKTYDLPAPPKSGCWFCPNRGKDYFMRLKESDPMRFSILQQMESNAAKRYPDNPPTFIHGFKLTSLVGQTKLDDFDIFADQMCDSGYCMT